MMELFDNLSLGFSQALTIQNLLYFFVGVVLGTIIGVLPGAGSTSASFFFYAVEKLVLRQYDQSQGPMLRDIFNLLFMSPG